MKTAHTTELVIPATDHESRTRCTAVAAKTRSVLATCTNPEECVYVHAELVGLLALLGEVGPSLQEAAPLIQTNGVDMAQVLARRMGIELPAAEVPYNVSARVDAKYAALVKDL